jgi:hypothetical protein
MALTQLQVLDQLAELQARNTSQASDSVEVLATLALQEMVLL